MLPSFSAPRHRFSNHADSSGPFLNRSVAVRVEFTSVKSEGIKSIILVISV